MEAQQKEEEQKALLDRQEWKNLETNLLKRGQTLKQQNEELTAAHNTLKQKYDTDILQFNSQKAEDQAANSERIQELEDIVKELEEQNDSLKSQTIKDQAVANQKLEFIKLQLE